MATPIMQVFSSCKPLVYAGETEHINVSQTLKDGGTDLLEATSSDDIEVKIDGPQTSLTPADIAGVYPAPGSDESPDEFLPHIALTRRTLPWERQGPAAGAPWMALLLFKESELKQDPEERKSSPKASLVATTVNNITDTASRTRYINTLKLSPDASVNVLYVPHNVLPSILPKSDDLEYLCHMKRKTENDVHQDVAIVMSNRLPDAGPEDGKPEIHTAVLVSLEQRNDMYAAGYFSNLAAKTALIVLHHWTFKPSKGGDFEQVMQAIGYRPNGGVLRFGNLPKPPAAGEQPPLSGPFAGILDPYGFYLEPLPHVQPGNVLFRGPLRPFQGQGRSPFFAIRAAPEELDPLDPSEPRDYSHAAAFEIGRLMAASDSGVLEDIREIHVIHQPIEVPLKANKMPQALQKPDWVSNPADWFEQPWEMEGVGNVLKNETQFLGAGPADVTGIGEHIEQWGDILVDLGGMATPVMQPVVAIDISTVNENVLQQKFAMVENVAKS